MRNSFSLNTEISRLACAMLAAAALIFCGSYDSRAEDQRSADIKTIQTSLNSRVNKLSNKEVHHLAAGMSAARPGRDRAMIIGLLVVAVLLLLMTYPDRFHETLAFARSLRFRAKPGTATKAEACVSAPNEEGNCFLVASGAEGDSSASGGEDAGGAEGA